MVDIRTSSNKQSRVSRLVFGNSKKRLSAITGQLQSFGSFDRTFTSAPHASKPSSTTSDDGSGSDDGLDKTSRHVSHRLATSTLRWPIRIAVLFILCFNLFIYKCFVELLHFAERAYAVIFGKRHNQALYGAVKEARTLKEWRERTRQLDKDLGRDEWKVEKESIQYDHQLIEQVTSVLRRYRQKHQQEMQTGYQSGDHSALESLQSVLLNSAVKHNLGGIDNGKLYSQTFYGTKNIIENYYAEVLESLKTVDASDTLNNEEKLRFFRRVSRSYGRTELSLSGGLAFGFYHLGTIKALLETGLLPTIISGSGVGSIIASFVCVRTDEELQGTFGPDLYAVFQSGQSSWLSRILRLLNEGSFFNTKEFVSAMYPITMGDTTFLEAFQRTGRILNITITVDEKTPPRLLNHRTTPNVIISSAVMTCISVPGLINDEHRLRSKFPHMENALPRQEAPEAPKGNKESSSAPSSPSAPYEGSFDDFQESLNRVRYPDRTEIVETLVMDLPDEMRLSLTEALSHAESAICPQMSSISEHALTAINKPIAKLQGSRFEIDMPFDSLHPLFNVKYTIVSQTNPGVILFFGNAKSSLYDDSFVASKCGGASFFTNLLESIIKLDMKRYIEFLNGIGLLPQWLHFDWSLELLQNFDSTANIMHAPGALDYFHLLSAPTYDRMKRYLRDGEFATWPKLCMIENRLRIEQFIQATKTHYSIINSRPTFAATLEDIAIINGVFPESTQHLAPSVFPSESEDEVDGGDHGERGDDGKDDALMRMTAKGQKRVSMFVSESRLKVPSDIVEGRDEELSPMNELGGNIVVEPERDTDEEGYGKISATSLPDASNDE